MVLTIEVAWTTVIGSVLIVVGLIGGLCLLFLRQLIGAFTGQHADQCPCEGCNGTLFCAETRPTLKPGRRCEIWKCPRCGYREPRVIHVHLRLAS